MKRNHWLYLSIAIPILTLLLAAATVVGAQGAVHYLNSYDPANLCTNYLGDAGSTSIQGARTFGVTVPAGTTLVVELEEYLAGAGCGSYTVTVSGLPCQGVTPTTTPCPITFTD